MPKGRYAPRHRGWMFTHFSPDFAPDDFFRRTEWARFIACQWEICPETGRRHCQGYLYGSTPRDLASVSQLFDPHNPHLEPRKGSHQQAVDYCTKEESRAPDCDPFVSGEPPKQGARNDLDQVKADLAEGGLHLAAENNFGAFLKYHKGMEKYLSLIAPTRDPTKDPECYYYWGPAGSGKTSATYELAESKGLELTQIYSCPLQGRTVWFDGFRPGHHGMILLDDYFRQWEATYFLKVLDRYPMLVPVKGGFVNLTNVIIMVTSNYALEDQYPDYVDQNAFRRRFVEIKQFKKLNDPPAKRQKTK